MDKHLDVVAFGRVGVDLYSQQIGCRLEDVSSFAKYIGGSPANTVIGASRLGLKCGLISAVGNDQLGRFILESLVKEEVDVTQVKIDISRLTAQAILGIADTKNFPLLFYRKDCPDMALTKDDIAEAFIASAKVLVVSGTHFSTPSTYQASMQAIDFAKKHNTKIVWDIDYRPVLWGLTSLADGENRFIADAKVSSRLAKVIPHCDVIVGTEEEVNIAGGSQDIQSSLENIRKQAPKAAIILKVGAKGCMVFDSKIPKNYSSEKIVEGFPIEVFNVLGAGDAFMGGFLYGYVKNKSLNEAAKIGNACGAIVVSRHACSPASPTLDELEHFLKNGSKHLKLRADQDLNHYHWATTRKPAAWKTLAILAFDHRWQFEEIANRHKQQFNKIIEFKKLLAQALLNIVNKHNNDNMQFGFLADSHYGSEIFPLFAADKIWMARPVEKANCFPLDFDVVEFKEPNNIGLEVNSWPKNHIIKCLVFHSLADKQDIQSQQLNKLKIIYEAAQATGHELLIEVILPKDLRPSNGLDHDKSIAASLQNIYDNGIKPDWWKIPAATSKEGGNNISAMIAKNDPYCRGYLLLGLEAPLQSLTEQFKQAKMDKACRGFAIGRSVFNGPADKWFAGVFKDQQAISEIENNFSMLIDGWNKA